MLINRFARMGNTVSRPYYFTLTSIRYTFLTSQRHELGKSSKYAGPGLKLTSNQMRVRWYRIRMINQDTRVNRDRCYGQIVHCAEL